MNQGGEGEGRSAPPVPPDEPSHVADLLALMPAQLRHLVEEPAALMRHELAAFDKELLAFWAVIRPEDAQEW